MIVMLFDTKDTGSSTGTNTGVLGYHTTEWYKNFRFLYSSIHCSNYSFSVHWYLYKTVYEINVLWMNESPLSSL